MTIVSIKILVRGYELSALFLLHSLAEILLYRELPLIHYFCVVILLVHLKKKKTHRINAWWFVFKDQFSEEKAGVRSWFCHGSPISLQNRDTHYPSCGDVWMLLAHSCWPLLRNISSTRSCLIQPYAHCGQTDPMTGHWFEVYAMSWTALLKSWQIWKAIPTPTQNIYNMRIN